jgi:site-specific DNA-cytosine methylase
MNILSVFGGIGSMVIGAKEQGYNILAGFDSRKGFHTITFQRNFDANLYNDFDKLLIEEDLYTEDVDMVVGHTSCGNYSRMASIQGIDRMRERAMDKGDIPYFINITKFIQPKFFILDNLPGAVGAVTPKEWIEAFPDYDIFFEWVSNYHYGNIQKGRNRLFVIGAKKDLGYVFIPGEFEHSKTLNDVIGDLPLEDDIEEINHIHVPDNTIISMKNKHIQRGVKPEDVRHLTLGEWKQWISQFPYGKRFQ